LFCSKYTNVFETKEDLRYDNFLRHVNKNHSDELKAVTSKIKQLQKKRKKFGTSSTPDEIVQNVKKWWFGRRRRGSVTSMFQMNKFTFLIRRSGKGIQGSLETL
jgi:hypothetical protein